MFIAMRSDSLFRADQVNQDVRNLCKRRIPEYGFGIDFEFIDTGMMSNLEAGMKKNSTPGFDGRCGGPYYKYSRPVYLEVIAWLIFQPAKTWDKE